MNYQTTRTSIPQGRDSFTSANVNHFLCEIANKNLVCIDNLLEQNRVIQNFLIDENTSTYQEDSFITMLGNIVNRNFQLAETILNQNDNIQTYFINNINQITNSTNNNNHSTNNHSTNNHSTTNNNNQSTSNHSTNNQSTTNSLYTNNNNLQPINNNNLQPINNNLQPERRSLNNHNRYLNNLHSLNNLDTHLSSLNNLSTNLANSLYPERQSNANANANNFSFQILYNSLPDISYNIEFYDISLNDPFFDSVRPVPSETQINRAIIQTLRYSDIISPVNDICPITREPFVDNSAVSVIRHCKHIFNRTELTNWFQYNCVCPVCRYDIREYSTVTENSNSNSNNNSQNNLNTSQLNNVITQTMLDLINEVTRQPR